MLNVITHDRFLRQKDVFGPDSGVGANTFRNAFVHGAFYVDPQNGSAAVSGRDPRRPVSTVSAALSACRSGDTVYVVGNITEEITGSNLMEDISIIGVANRPRHADHARDIATYTTYLGSSGASWRQASSHGATTPLLKVRAQGWHIENILFVPPSDAAAIYLERNALENVSEYDASHAVIKGCRFAGGQDGVVDSGGCHNVIVEGNVFHQQSSVGIETLSTSVAVPLRWQVLNNYFSQGTEHVKVSANYWLVKGNTFGRFSGTYSLNLKAVSAQGEYNEVHGNYFSGDYDGAYLGGANDDWSGNYSMDVSSGEVGAEGLTTAAPVA